MQNYIISLGEASETPIKGTDKVGGLPTYMPNKIPRPTPISGYFLMEIYNHGFDDDEDIICWQFYQGEKGGFIDEVIEIRKGASLYDDKSELICKRRWLREYSIQFEACESNQLNENVSRIGGDIPSVAVKDIKRKKIRYLGTIKEDFCPNDELGLKDYDIVIGFDKKGKMGGWSFDED